MYNAVFSIEATNVTINVNTEFKRHHKMPFYFHAARLFSAAATSAHSAQTNHPQLATRLLLNFVRILYVINLSTAASKESFYIAGSILRILFGPDTRVGEVDAELRI